MSKTTLHINDKAVTLESLEKKGGALAFTIGGKRFAFRSHKLPDGTFALEQETAPGQWSRVTGGAWASGKNTRRVQVGELEARVSDMLPGASGASASGALSPLAPMPGLVRQILVKKGDSVKQGQTVAVLEAMKLQLALPAGGDAVVEAVLVKEGQMIPEGTELVKLAPKAKKG